LIEDGTYPLDHVLLEADTTLQPYISFKSLTRTIVFSGDDASAQLSGSFFRIDIELVNEEGGSTEYTQVVIVQTPLAEDATLEETATVAEGEVAETEEDSTDPEIVTVIDIDTLRSKYGIRTSTTT